MDSMRLLRASMSASTSSTFPAWANCFKVSLKSSLTFHQYDVISPEVAARKRRREVIEELVFNNRKDFIDSSVSYDGKAMMYILNDLGLEDIKKTYTVQDILPKGRIFKVTLTKVGTISSRPFESFLAFDKRPDPDFNEAKSFIQGLNLLLRNYFPRYEVLNIGSKSLVLNGERRDLKMGLELCHGCVSNRSIRPSFENALLNIDVMSIVSYKKQELIKTCMELLGCEDTRELRSPRNIFKLEILLKGIRVRQINAGQVGNERTIRKIVQNAGDCVFDRDGDSISVMDYFQQRHNYKLKLGPKLPGIETERTDNLTGEKSSEIIPFELLEVIENQIYKRRLSPVIREQIQKFTTTSPVDRKKTITKFFKGLDARGLSNVGLDVQETLLSVNGKILHPPEINFQNKSVHPAQGRWSLGRAIEGHSRVFMPCKLKIWAILSYEPRLCFSSRGSRSTGQSTGHEFLKNLVECMQAMGIGLPIHYKDLRHPIVIREENPQGSVREHAKSIIMTIWKEYRTLKLGIDNFILLVFLPAHGSTVYEQIKEMGDTTAVSGSPGFATQCVNSSKLLDSNKKIGDTYHKNLLLKINAKLGGINYIAKGNGMEILEECPIMIAGADVSHPRPGTHRPSVASLVASVDANACRYVVDVSSQTARSEPMQQLRPMFTKALRLFRDYPFREKKQLPWRIVLYRDGLSEGEFKPVTDEEIELIKGAIEDVWEEQESELADKIPAAKVELTYIIVVKRHHIRFFPKDGNRVGVSGNCPSGFLVDGKEIMNPLTNGFYLLSHEGILGTSRPSYYIIIRNECGFSKLELEKLSFGLCHVFSRCTRAISLPAPVAYAHLACRRADIHLRRKDTGSEAEFLEQEHEGTEEDWEFSPLQGWREKFMPFI